MILIMVLGIIVGNSTDSDKAAIWAASAHWNDSDPNYANEDREERIGWKTHESLPIN